MPYIDLLSRLRVLPVSSLKRINPKTTGELNYVLTSIIMQYLSEFVISYNRYNEAIGVLECVKQELYRRMVGPYEDKKKEENGDVY